MINLRILAPSQIKYFGDLYPFRRWNVQLQEAGINVEIFFDHKNRKLFNSDRVLLHHRYFDSGWVNALKTATDVNGDFINYLSNLRANVGKLIWFDADDSSGTTQFPVIPSALRIFATSSKVKTGATPGHLFRLVACTFRK